MNITDRLSEQLQRLFIKQEFLERISIYRKQFGIPNNGFYSNKEYLEWIESHDPRIFHEIQDARFELSERFKLSIQYSTWIEAFLILDHHYLEFDETILPFKKSAYYRGYENPSFACAMEKDESLRCVNIKIFPNSSYREVMKYVKENWENINEFLEPFEFKTNPIRKRRRKDRDSAIFGYYKKGWLDSYGRIPFKDKEAIPNSIPEDIKKLGSDYLKKIIDQQKKLRK